jgi:hypothetical protein
LVVLVQLDFLPQLVGFVGSFCCFHVQIADAFLLADSGVLGVGEGTGFAVAQAGQVVLVFAEVLGFSSTGIDL